jgi:hypothetical protein
LANQQSPSDEMLAQQPLESAGQFPLPGAHADSTRGVQVQLKQKPAAQVFEHGLPQLPQLLESFDRFTQPVPGQKVSPEAAHPHAPAEQVPSRQSATVSKAVPVALHCTTSPSRHSAGAPGKQTCGTHPPPLHTWKRGHAESL